jgi:hypothetical protein
LLQTKLNCYVGRKPLKLRNACPAPLISVQHPLIEASYPVGKTIRRTLFTVPPATVLEGGITPERITREIPSRTPRSFTRETLRGLLGSIG